MIVSTVYDACIITALSLVATHWVQPHRVMALKDAKHIHEHYSYRQ